MHFGLSRSQGGPLYNGKYTTTYSGWFPLLGDFPLSNTFSITVPHAPLCNPHKGKKFLPFIETLHPLHRRAAWFTPLPRKCLLTAFEYLLDTATGLQMAVGLAGLLISDSLERLCVIRFLLVKKRCMAFSSMSDTALSPCFFLISSMCRSVVF